VDISFIQVLENSCDHLGLGDKGDDSQPAATLTDERVGFVDTSDQIRPSFSERGTLLRRRLGVVCFLTVVAGGRRPKFWTLVLLQSACLRRIESEIVHAVFARLRDLGEDASDELEDIESLSDGMLSERLVMRSLTFIEEGSCAGSPVDAGQGDRASQEVTREPFDAFGVGWPDGWRSVDGESGVSKRSEELDTLFGEESFGLEQVQDFVSEELLGGMGIEVGDGSPMTWVIPNSSGSKTVNVRVGIQDTAEGLGYGDDAGACLFVTHGFSHQLLDRRVSEPCQITQELSVVHKIRAKHLWNREGPE